MAYYDDDHYNYNRFWDQRQYEHASEILALQRLLQRQKVEVVADVGGGYGRLSKWLAHENYKFFLVEPSKKMRDMSARYLKSVKQVVVRSGSAQDTNLPAKSVDAAIMVRVMHHLPAPKSAIAEMHRILKPKGVLILEFANSIHFVARIKSLVSGRPILPVVLERRSSKSIQARTIPFVNHHPITVMKLLRSQGFEVEEVLSVSNWRNEWIKRLVPLSILISLESSCQQNLSGLYFGPSIFVRARKVDKI